MLLNHLVLTYKGGLYSAFAKILKFENSILVTDENLYKIIEK